MVAVRHLRERNGGGQRENGHPPSLCEALLPPVLVSPPAVNIFINLLVIKHIPILAPVSSHSLNRASY